MAMCYRNLCFNLWRCIRWNINIHKVSDLSGSVKLMDLNCQRCHELTHISRYCKQASGTETR